MHSQAMDLAYRPFSNGSFTKAAVVGVEADAEVMDQFGLAQGMIHLRMGSHQQWSWHAVVIHYEVA